MINKTVRRHQPRERCRGSGLGKGTDLGMGFFETEPETKTSV